MGLRRLVLAAAALSLALAIDATTSPALANGAASPPAVAPKPPPAVPRPVVPAALRRPAAPPPAAVRTALQASVQKKPAAVAAAPAPTELPPRPPALYLNAKDGTGRRVAVTFHALTREEAKEHARDLLSKEEKNLVAHRTSGFVASFGNGANDIKADGLVAEIDGKKRYVGFMVTPSTHDSKIELIHADASVGLQGVGTIMLGEQIRRAFGTATPYLVLHAVSTAEAFYERWGFVAVGPKHEGLQMMHLYRAEMPNVLARMYELHGGE